jgi:hypothetical protein
VDNVTGTDLFQEIFRQLDFTARNRVANGPAFPYSILPPADVKNRHAMYCLCMPVVKNFTYKTSRADSVTG